MNPDALTYASVCSGIESASVAWEPLGMRPIWFSEIEPFPSAVLAYHWPHVHNWGDFTKIPARTMRGAADILVGGTPCQAFSVAGKRESLNDDRGNLTLEFCRLADDLDPHVVVWENVPGVLTTDDNAFGCFLAKLCGNEQPALPTEPPTEQEILRNAKVPRITGPKSKHWRWDKNKLSFVPKWPTCGAAVGPDRRVAWRILDAQYFGVAQRRRRVFVVSSPRDHIAPAKILFEFDGVRRDTPPSRETGQDAAGFTSSSFAGYREGVGTLKASGGDLGGGSETLTVHGTITARMFNALGARGVEEGALRVEGARARKLTPIECELLQGFPPNHTLLPYGTKAKVDAELKEYYQRWLGRELSDDEVRSFCGDGPRYRAIGNSKAVPVVRWIGERIIKHLKGEI